MAAMTPGAAAAQSLVASATGGASYVTGIGDRDHAFHFGGGIEFGGGPLRLGGEIGLVHFPEKTSTFDNGRGSGKMPAVTEAAFSFRTSYYPTRFAGKRLQPFVAGGLTVYTDAEGFATLDGGGGFDWWSSRHAGLRVEVLERFGGLLSARVGVVLR